MDKLLEPDFGLVFWTIVTFFCLVFILAKTAWKPLLSSIEGREARMKADRDGAQAARAEAEKIKSELEARLAGADARVAAMLAQANKDGEALRAQLKEAAEADARQIKTKTAIELAQEKERLVRELRKDVADLSVLAAERLLRKSVDDGVQKTVLDSFFKDLDAHGKQS